MCFLPDTVGRVVSQTVRDFKSYGSSYQEVFLNCVVLQGLNLLSSDPVEFLVELR